MADTPLLALPGGSITQFLIMTLPLLGVYLYFLYLAFNRPSIADPNNPHYSDDRIRLTAILYTYLASLFAFASLVVYLLWFVWKRRSLSRRYAREAVTVLGDVKYDDRTPGLLGRLADGFSRRTDYGYVVYDLARVANHPACDYEARRGKKLAGFVTKRVRVYYRYPREQVSILVLPEHPLSGQPKTDMEADWACFAETAGLDPNEDSETQNESRAAPAAPRDRSRGILAIALGWVLFLLLTSLYVTVQINAVEDYYEDEDGQWAWKVFWSGVGGGALVACVANFVRWKIYEHWILASGKKHRSKTKMSRTEENSDDGMDDEGASYEGSYIQMS